MVKNCSMKTCTELIGRDETDSKQEGILRMTFNKYIRVTNAEYSYTELELLAEFGGYVGLFLGMSVFHLSVMFDKILEYTISC